MTALKWLLVVAAVGYLGALAALYLLQRSFLFPVPQAVRTTPVAAGFPAVEEHLLTTDDGEKVIVWHMAAKPGRPVILYFHGNGDFLAGFFGRFRELIADGAGVVALSYRGYAGSSGYPSEHGLLRDAAAAYAFTTERYAVARIVVWGFSLGSGVAVALAAERPVDRVILEAPYASIAEIAMSAFPIFPVRLVMRDPFHSDRRIRQMNAPLLFMHGVRDETIPISSGERLFALAPEPKQFVRFAEGGHNDLDAHGAMATVRQFIGTAQAR